MLRNKKVMESKFRNLRIGFANVVMLGNFEKEAEDKALAISNSIKNYIKDELNVDVYSNISAITNFDEANAAWKFFQSSNIDAIILFNGTFSLSNLACEIVRNSNVPLIAWGLEEYLIEKQILSGSMIGLMPIGSICKYLKKNFSFIYGQLGNPETKQRLKILVDIIRAIAFLKESKIGLMGSRPDGFEIAGFDELAIKRIFGTTIIKVSMNELLCSIDNVNRTDVENDSIKQKNLIDISKKDLEKSKELSKIYIGIKKIIDQKKLQGYAPQCWPELRMNRKTPMCTANGRICAEGVMASCECDMDCTLTMLLLYAITGNTPWTADFVNYIEKKESLLFWHCGNASYNLSNKKPKLEVVFEGLAQTASLKPGVVTIARLNHFEGNFKLFAGIGEVIDSEPIFKGSNMLVQMSCGNMNFIKTMLEEGVPHHVAIVYGDLSEHLMEYAKLMNLEAVIKK